LLTGSAQSTDALCSQARLQGEGEDSVKGQALGTEQGERLGGLAAAMFFNIPNNWYVNPTLILGRMLTIPYPDAICSLILSTPVNIIQANSYKNMIHRGPNVSLPKEIELDLSVGMHYMFHSP
jgi:hypothetical protein